MAVALGRTIGSPIFLFFQIIHGVSLFFVMMGAARVFLGVLELTTYAAGHAATLKPSSTTKLAPRPELLFLRAPPAAPVTISFSTVPPHRCSGVCDGASPHQRYAAPMAADQVGPVAKEPLFSFFSQLSNCFHVPLQSLFHSPVSIYVSAQHAAEPLGRDTYKAQPLRYDGSNGRFYLQHFIAAALCAYPLTMLLQRCRFVLDFVVTIYVVYWLFTDLMLQAMLGGGTWHWWGACLLGLATMYGSTYALCRRKEMQEVKLSSGGGAGPSAGANTANVLTSTTTPTSTWLKDSHGDDVKDAREMEEIRSPFQETIGQPGPAAAVAAVSGGGMPVLFPDKTGGRGRTTAVGATSPRPVMVDISGADEEQFKSKFM